MFSTSYRQVGTAQPESARDVAKRMGGWRDDPACGLLPLVRVRHRAWREIVVASAFAALAGCVSFDVGHSPVVSTRPVTAADLERPANLSRVAHGRGGP